MNTLLPDLEAVHAAPRRSGHADAAVPARPRWISGSNGRTAKLVAVDEVLFLACDDGHTRVVSAADELRVRAPLQQLAALLDPLRFWRIDSHLVVRADAVARARHDGRGGLTLQLRQHPEALPVAPAYAWRFEPG